MRSRSTDAPLFRHENYGRWSPRSWTIRLLDPQSREVDSRDSWLVSIRIPLLPALDFNGDRKKRGHNLDPKGNRKSRDIGRGEEGVMNQDF